MQEVIAWVQTLQGDLSAANSTTAALNTFGSCDAANPFRSTIYLAKISTKLLLLSRVLVPVLGACLICALMALEWDGRRQGGHHDDELHDHLPRPRRAHPWRRLPVHQRLPLQLPASPSTWGPEPRSAHAGILPARLARRLLASDRPRRARA